MAEPEKEKEPQQEPAVEATKEPEEKLEKVEEDKKEEEEAKNGEAEAGEAEDGEEEDGEEEEDDEDDEEEESSEEEAPVPAKQKSLSKFVLVCFIAQRFFYSKDKPNKLSNYFSYTSLSRKQTASCLSSMIW